MPYGYAFEAASDVTAAGRYRDGVLTLSTPTGIAADRIKRDYVAAVPRAAEVAEVFVERVVTVRKR